MDDNRKPRRRRAKVQPSADDDDILANGRHAVAMKAFRINTTDKKKKGDESDGIGFHALGQAQMMASKWQEYIKTKRRQKNEDETVPKPGVAVRSSAMRRQIARKNTSGMGLDDLSEENVLKPPPGREDTVDGDLDSTKKHIIVASNRTLIQYFGKLAGAEGSEVNLDFVESLLSNGAKIGSTDIFGQTIFHEVARVWHTDVARFLIENEADPNVKDDFGWTPLHVAAAVDYPEMVKFLVDNGADIEATTKDKQTPCHFAAKNDACQSLKMLLKLGCDRSAIDYKRRTPLQLAAELDRSETARLLVEAGCDASLRDDSGQSAIVWMICKMAPVAKIGLDQFHVMDRANRKQYYHLNRLEPDNSDQSGTGKHPVNSQAQNALEMVTSTTQYDLVTHPAIKRLIAVKWQQFGRVGAWLQVVQSAVFIMLYTVLGVYPDWKIRYLYNFPVDSWRVIFWIVAIGMTIYQVVAEVIEYFKSSRRHKAWKNWRTEEIARDVDCCHPRWPEEKEYLEMELDLLDKKAPTYFKDLWNLLDWLCYLLLLTCIITHIVDVAYHSIELARAHIRIMSVNLIFLWLRLMKSTRAFEALGPFIVILGKMLGDCLRFLFLYLVFFLPFYCAFWMTFGGENTRDRSLLANQSVSSTDTIVVAGYGTPWDLVVSLFRLTLVDDYPYDELNEVDPLMAKIMIVAWLALSAILCLNLFIALLSDTFQRVYDNAYANAVMQKAQTIISIQDNMLTKGQRDKYRKLINKNYAPEELYYDDDLAPVEDDLQKVTIQIKEDLDDFKEYVTKKLGPEPYGGDAPETIVQSLKSTLSATNGGKDGAGAGAGVTSKQLRNEVDLVREEIQVLQASHQSFKDRYKRDIADIKTLLETLSRSSGAGDGGSRRPDDTERSGGQVAPRTVRVQQRPADVADPGLVRSRAPEPVSGHVEPDVDVDVLAAHLEAPSVGYPFSRSPFDDSSHA